MLSLCSLLLSPPKSPTGNFRNTHHMSLSAHGHSTLLTKEDFRPEVPLRRLPCNSRPHFSSALAALGTGLVSAVLSCCKQAMRSSLLLTSSCARLQRCARGGKAAAGTLTARQAARTTPIRIVHRPTETAEQKIAEAQGPLPAPRCA